MTDLSTRYGAPSPVQRIIALTLVVALAGSGIAYLGWAVVFHSKPAVQSRLTAFDVTGEHSATASFNVSRASTDTQASCRLQAFAEDHSVVGELDVPVTSGPKVQSLGVDLRTDREATSIELVGCTAPDQTRPR